MPVMKNADAVKGLDLDEAKPEKKSKVNFFGQGLEDTSFKRAPSKIVEAPVPLEHNRIRLLAAVIYAQFAGTATVEEIGPGQLRIQTQGRSFALSVGSEGRILLSGFTQQPNLKQHVGKLTSENIESNIWSITEKVLTLVTDSLDSEELPEPAYFPSAEVVNEIQGGNPGLAPPETSLPSEEKPEDFQTSQELPPAEQGMEDPANSEVKDISPGVEPGGDFNFELPPPPGGAQQQVPAANAQPNPFDLGPPTAARRASVEALDGLASELESLGFIQLAKRVDMVTNSLSQEE